MGQVNLTLIPQHAPARTEGDTRPRSARKDVPLRLVEQVRPAPTDPNAPLRLAGEDATLRLPEQVLPALTDLAGGSKRPIADVAESKSSSQPLKQSRVMTLR